MKRVSPLEVLELLVRIGKPIRLAGAQWIISDVFGVIDHEAREVLYRLKDMGSINIKHGWIQLSPSTEAFYSR